MAWVTLALRKAELKSLHNEYVMEDLRISREERQMARHYQSEQTQVQNQQSRSLRGARSDYSSKRQNYYDQIAELRTQKAQETDPTKIAEIENQITQYQLDIEKAKEDFESFRDTDQSYYEDELAMLEEEANERETILENEKVEIETQMEAVANELQAVSDAISNEIQQCTIKLS